MADAAVSFAIENLGNFLIQEGKFLSEVKDEVEDMQIELEWMQSFLKDAERRKGESHGVQKWVKEIREATYDVEDLIERFFIKSALRDRKGFVNSIKKYSCCWINHAAEIHQVGTRIKDIKARLSKLRTRLEIYGIRKLKVGREEVAAYGASATRRRKRQDYSHVVDHNVVGLDEKIKGLVQHLLDVQKEPVVCLYGMGGLGKTTTAKQVYNNNEIRTYFGGFAWVYISQQFNPEQVLGSVLTQLSSKKTEEVEKMSIEELSSQLCDVQKEKRCLVVIDDIWHSKDWAKLSAAFPDTENGNISKILLTSRSQDVVSGRVYRTSLEILDDNCSLELLKKTISSLDPYHPIKADPKMPKCTGNMVKQCGGLPLAIIVLGGILATRHDLHKWEKVSADIKLVLKRVEQEGKEGVSTVLESSYEDLPYNLRSCFLYFSRYPEDEEIKTTDLKQKWIGEGFISSSVEEGDETMEGIAEEYLLELVRRCMIQVVRKGHTGRVKTCRIHDLMRDLCISKANEEGFAHSIKLGVENEGTDFKKVSSRRLCIASGNLKLSESVLYSLPHLRSIWFQDNLDDKEAVLIVKKLKLVRVLELPRPMGKTKSGREEVGNLIHLRYLNLEVSMLPTSMGKLICLQTLNLERCDSDLVIPDSVWRMERLRHLYLPRDGCVCESAKQLVGDFKKLQTLVNFPPKNFDLEQNLVKFINVRKLVITNKCKEICKILACNRKTVFKRLESLSFTESSENSVQQRAVTRSCPRLYRLLVIAPLTCWSVSWPSDLTKLVLKHSGLNERHMRSLGKLQSLKVLFLQLDAFIGKEMIFDENDFPQLHHLILQNLKHLKVWAVKEGALPSLSCLEIVNCWELESVGDGAQYLKQLKELKVKTMPYMFRKRLEIGGEDWDRVKNVSSISFSYCYPELDDHTSLDILDENSSLDLFKKAILFLGGPDHPITENSEMETSAREMVKVCKGVQLAITLLGRILARKHKMIEWESIASVLREGLLKEKDGVTSVLELSYEDLPSNLKPCFLYFSQYVKDEEIKTIEIVQRWIGEGFVTSSMDESMEDVGTKHLKELVTRRLIQVVKRSHRGRVKTCRMQEVVLHFCVSKAKEELKLGVDLTFLKVEGSELPESFENLRCLQTLNLERCVNDLIIPDWVWEMEQLRHLYLPKRGGICESSRQQVGDFLNLQTLVNFPPLNFNLEQNLVKFRNVRKLVIIERQGEMGSILRSQRIVFNRLQSLSFTYSTYGQLVDLEAFTRGCLLCLYRLRVDRSIKLTDYSHRHLQTQKINWPSNLTNLVLESTELDQSQLWSLAKLQSLKVLFLQRNAFTGNEMIFHRKDFPQLHHLILQNLKDLKAWKVQEGGLPSLLCLEIVNCWELKSIGDGAQYLKQLKELKVTSMPYLFRKRLEEWGEDWDRFRHVPSISFSDCYYSELKIDDHTSSDILDENSSLELLTKTILSLGGPDHLITEHSEMETSAREMVKICGGVPVAITILGGILATKHEMKEWESIKSVLKAGEQKWNDAVASVLELSYKDLPCNLKPYLLCFGQYVKNEKIKISEIIQRWIGEGFIASSMENVGREHLNELVTRCLIQVGKRSCRGRVKTCRVHEFVWHFCVSKAKEEGIASSVKVLSLPRLDEKGREQIGNLVELTFLKLEGAELPKSFEKLRCLQTLNLERCDKDLIIPDCVWGMEQLRHLYLPEGGSVCESSRQQVGDFLNLETLVNFPPRNFDLQQNLVKFSKVRKLVIIEKCEEMSRILRSQEIVFNLLQSLSYTNSSYKMVDLEAFVRGCPCLYRLLIQGSIDFPAAPSCTTAWPSNLIKLVLTCTQIDQSQLGSLGKLQILRVLFLQRNAFVGKEMVFHQNDFPQLHHLILQNLKSLKAWAVKEGGLPSLSCLEIVNCWELKSVGDGAQYLKQLKELKVTSMPYIFRKRLEIGGEDWDRVREVPSISFSYCYPELEIDDHTISDILDENGSLELLHKAILFLGGPDHPITENSEMETSAGEMVKVCKGVQLAITLLGRILARKHKMKEWESIASVLREGQLKENDGVTSVLELSYEDLPSNLKPCFLYFGQYAKDEEIKTIEIVQRWIGEGFVKYSMDESMEDVGTKHLKELVTRGLIQVGKRSHRGRVKTCRMQEVVLHFCVSKAKEEPKLGVEGSDLPKSFENLRCLQTLTLEKCGRKIPGWVWGMEQLRHLYLPEGGSVCESSGQQVGDFSNLQTLVNFPPSNFDLQQSLVKFSNIRKLVIIEKGEEMGRILRSQEIVFNRLQSLSFTKANTYGEEVDLEAFARGCPCLYKLFVDGSIKFPAPIWPSNLTKLVLQSTQLEQGQLGSLTKLQSLKVLFLQRNAFAGKEMVFHQNDFPQLRHLILQNLKNLKAWEIEEGGLPSLSCLEIVSCWGLESVGDGAQYLKQLKELKVKAMPCKFRKRLEKGGEDWDRVRNVPSISFSYCYPESVILDENNSLELLNKTILSLGGPDHPIIEYSDMNTSAREIEKVCEGVPLAITILGSILATKHEMKEWESIQSLLRDVEQKGNDVPSNLLEFRYEDLPCNLKPCFLYFGQYEKDEEIKTSEMIQRWIGEGFVTGETMEDVAQEHLKELVSRGLIQVRKRCHRGRVKTCRMHEFVWHFCVSKVKEEGFVRSIELEDQDEITELPEVGFQRLCISSGGISCKLGGSIISSLVESSPQLVSMWCQDPQVSWYDRNEIDGEQGEAVVLIVRNLKSVKVLRLPCKIWSLLDEGGREDIGNLVNLRFLKLEGTELPKSLGNLRCLQTLNLERCGKDLIIPDSVWGMGQLRHLYLPKEGCKCETSTQRVGDFPNLLTLVNFPPANFDLEQNLVKFTGVRKLVLSDWVGKICSILRSQGIVFKRLQSLSYNLHKRKEDLEVFTRGCPCLYRLSVNGPIEFPAAPSCTSVWPSTLTKLVLHSCKIGQSQLGSLAKLHSLQVLILQQNAFAGKEMVFHKNDFPQLRHITIDHLLNLETWTVHEGAMSNLISLEIVYCPGLKSVPDGSQYLKKLKDLKVRNMCRSFRKRLEEGGEDWDRVRHVPSISFINWWN